MTGRVLSPSNAGRAIVAGCRDVRSTSPVRSAANSLSAATDAAKPPRRSRLYPSTGSGTIAGMDARSEPGPNDPFEEAIDDALSSLPADLLAAMTNIEIVVEVPT